MRWIQTTAVALLALVPGVQAQEGPPPLDIKAVALTAELFNAIRAGDKAALVAALEHGADTNRPNWIGLTPLDGALMLGRKELLPALESKGAKTSLGIYGTTISMAAMMGQDGTAVQFLKQGVGATSTRPDKATTLMLAAAFGAPKLIDALKPDAAELAKQDVDGATALIYAARRGQVTTSKRLLAHGAKVDQADSHGRTPLMYAVMNGYPAVTELLLAAGAKPNLVDKERATALHLAARYSGQSALGKSLLKAKASVSLADAHGKTPLALAEARGFSELAGTLRGAGARSTTKPALPSAGSAVQRSLVAMQSGMKRFQAQSECVSCHHQGLGLAVLGAARLKGFAVNQGVVDDNVKRIGDNLKQMAPLIGLSQSDPKLAHIVPTAEIDEVAILGAYLFWGLDAARVPTNPETQAFAGYVAQLQQPAGNWRFTLHRGPMQESNHTTTAFQLLGMKRYMAPAQSAPLVAKAQAWLKSAPTPTTEDQAMRLLGLYWSGLSVSQLKGEPKKLLALQHTDGGWGARPGAPSDALTTGLVLYSLRVAGGLAPKTPAVQQAASYLRRTQDENGTWYLNKLIQPFNYFFDTGFPGGESQYSSFAATGWATLALMEVADRPKTARR